MSRTFLDYVVWTKPGDIIEVRLTGNAANVLLLDDSNFQNYRTEKRFQYHGGYYTSSPAVLSAPSPGKWHVVIDTGGRAGHVTAAVRVIHSYG